LQGVYPPHVSCHRCGEQFAGRAESGAWLSSTDGILTCASCADGAGGRRLGTRLTPGALAFLSSARRRSPSELRDIGVSGAVLTELEALHRGLMARHLERELRSLRVLREMRREPHPAAGAAE
jgi:Recombination protein O C terminal